MVILFIDFDGVLNSERYVRSCGHYGVVIDPARMVLLKHIIDSTKAKIVLSTSWREHWEKEKGLCDDTGNEINRIFGEYQLTIYDKTPKLKGREEEIRSWLDNNSDVEAYAVLDDAFLSADFLDGRFIRTSNYRNGLEEEDAKAAISILNCGLCKSE